MGKIIGLLVIALSVVSCTQDGKQSKTNSSSVQTIQIDGSSTVYPLTEAVVEEFQGERKNVRLTIGVSGTGGGMKKFLNGEVEIIGASRTIKPVEIEEGKKNNIEYVELKVAFDGLSVVVNPKNDFVDHLTIQELKKIWKAGSTVKTWKDIRSEWPDEEIVLYGPGTDSGTFDYFVEAILEHEGAIRPDFTASENDHVLVQGVSGDEFGLAYFGYAYYLENQDKLRLIGIDNGQGPVLPSPETVKSNEYAPLSRPIYIYVNQQALEKPLILDFVSYYLNSAKTLAPAVGYIALDEDTLAQEFSKINPE